MTNNPAQPLQRERGLLRRILDRFPGFRADSELTGRQNVLYAAIELRGSEVNTLRTIVQNRARNAYVDAIQAELRNGECTPVANNPSGSDANALAEIVNRDVDSIVETFNREAKKQVVKLTEANPNWSKREFRQALATWADNRMATKNRTIIRATRGNAEEYARKRFYQENGNQGSFTWDASPPIVPNSHKECIARVRGGAVSWDIAQNWERTHPNCRHKVKKVGANRLNCADVWRG